MKIEYWKLLTDKERQAVGRTAARIRWGFTPETIRKQFHRFQKGDNKVKAKVCALLEECNYHTLCGYLSNLDIVAAKMWIDTEMPIKEVTPPEGGERQLVDAYIMEGSKGKFLCCNENEYEDGTWWSWTESKWRAYWNRSLESLMAIGATEFSDFEKDYPKYHKVRFTYEMLETVQG